MFDRDADWQALVDFVLDPQQRPLLGVVSGRRRQGKSYLLNALAEAFGGFYFEAAEATEVESLRMFGAAVARYTGAPAPLAFSTWREALAVVFELAADRQLPIIIDEFPYLMKASPGLPSVLQGIIDQHSHTDTGRGQPRVLICGSAMSVMGELLAGTAPLRGRASLEIVVNPFDYALAARFWGINDPVLAVMTNAVVGGTPAYRREFVRDDVPADLADFDSWVQRAVLNPRRPLFREARYLLTEEIAIRDPALYHSTLAAIAEGNSTRGGIANYLGRKTADISHPLAVLEDSRLICREDDAFREGRSKYLIREPLIAFYEAVMRPRWRFLEMGNAEAVWQNSKSRFESNILGPHFETICREFVSTHATRLLTELPERISAGTVADPTRKTQIEVDIAATASGKPGHPEAILGLGEVKWGKTMTLRHLQRLHRARDLLAVKGFATADTSFLLCSGAGFDDQLRDAASRGNVCLVGTSELYAE